ncbi:MAG TPA: hypothetical protein VFT82_00395, partial [Candidatus Paceibacterota bacterium]|nr:hypothetical protein [Candidatus Paceibacterota bacterium]
SDVTRWEVPQKGSMEVYGKNKKVKEVLPYDKIMTLIGYAQSQETMAALGCTYDDENRCGIFDYDGECVKTPGSVDPARRIHKGYFCFGSVLEGPLTRTHL